ncbi:hypothetical protein ACLOJK_008530 [Asimina triloba]
MRMDGMADRWAIVAGFGAGGFGTDDRTEPLDSSAERQGRADGAVRMGFYPNWIDVGHCRSVAENGEMGLDGGRRTLEPGLDVDVVASWA